MQELVIISILLVLSIASFCLHYKKERSTKLGVSHASRRRVTTTVTEENLSELTTFLPVALNQLYENDLLKVGQSPRHTLISCCLIIKKINQLYYPGQSLSTTELIQQLLADGYITQDFLAWSTVFEAFGDGDIAKIEEANTHNNAANLKAFVCKLLHMLYVTPNVRTVSKAA